MVKDRRADGDDAVKDRRARGRLDAELDIHLRALRRYATALIGNASDADDLVHDTIVRAYRKLQPWARVRDVRAYLFTILHNVHADTVRRRHALSDPVPIDSVVTRLATPPAQDSRLALHDLYRSLGQIAEEQREVILLVGLEGMTYRETADVLGVPIGTVMSRLSRGRQVLRALMEGGNVAGFRKVK